MPANDLLYANNFRKSAVCIDQILILYPMDTLPQQSAISAKQNSGISPSHIMVLACGVLTAILTLIGVYLLDKSVPDFYIMGWHADYVIPAGAIIVGLVAGSGYGIASWFSGIRITGAVLWIVLILQFAAYFGAEYVEFKQMNLQYKNTGRPVSFLTYFDLEARSFAWKGEDGKQGTPLGVWGYAFRGLEIAGFALGGLLIPLALFKAPYCSGCRRYMRKKLLALIPGCVPKEKIKKSDLQKLKEFQEKQTNAVQAATQLIEMLRKAAAEARIEDFQIAALPPSL